MLWVESMSKCSSVVENVNPSNKEATSLCKTSLIVGMFIFFSMDQFPFSKMYNIGKDIASIVHVSAVL